MSVKSACNYIPDSLVRHAEIMSKAELEADMNDMKSKWNRSRICHNNSSSQKRKPWKGDDRSVRGRRNKSGNDKNREPNGTADNKANNDENMGKAKASDVVDSSCLERIPRLPSESASTDVLSKPKKVHFDEDHLAVVTEFPDDEESVNMRKCYWEIFAIDRCRFKDRIQEAEATLKLILLPDHRQRIYNQRFLPSIET